VRWRAALAGFIALCALAALAPAAGTQSALPQSSPYLWRSATGGQIRGRPAVGPDGTTYALSEDSYLYAWVSGGSLLWKHDLGWLPWDCLAVSGDGTVYAGLRNQDFIAVNPRGGRLWTVRLDGLPAGDPAVAEDGTVLVGTSAGTLSALSHLGRREWAVTLPGAVTGQPIIDGAGTIYVTAADRRLYALTPWGEFKWSLPFTAAPGAPSIAADGSVVLGTDTGEVVAVSPSGDAMWKKSLGAPVIGVAADALQIVADTRAGRVAGFTLDGRELWRTDTGRTLGSPPFIRGDLVFLTAQDGSLVALDSHHAVSGTLKTAAVGGATAAESGEILVGGRDWIVYSLDMAATGLPVPGPGTPAPWPQSGHDARHSGRTEAAPAADNDALLALNPDYLYLKALSGTPGREGIQLVLADIGRRISSRSLDKSTWYAVRMLENVVGTGLANRSLLNQKVVNDFPDLRAAAAGLLARVGSTASRAALLDAVNAEVDGVALAAEIGALGAIASDGDGAALRAIVRAFTSRAGLPPDSRLASAVADSIGRIAVYTGALGEPSAIATLLAISRGSYDPSVRSAAQSILQGELKTDILKDEE
jgi:outer membrane protein assembly factor BamB